MFRPPFLRRSLWTLALIPFLVWGTAHAATLRSPDGVLVAEVTANADGKLVYSVRRANMTVIQPSRIGVGIDGVDLGSGVILGEPIAGKIDETFSVPGVKRVSHGRANTLTVPVTHLASGAAYTLEARAYDDGFAWCLRLPGTGTRRVTCEASSWTLPPRSRVWLAERNSPWKLKTYAGAFVATDIETLPTFSAQGPVQCPPLVVELPDGAGYAAITEAALADYSGMRLRATGGRIQADFTEGSKGFEIAGDITTPWRVTLVAPDLDRLVNNDVILALNPPPDPGLFADTSYIRPGRSVWRWWSRGTGSPVEERAMIDDAVTLGFEYTLIDDGWEKWRDSWTRLAELCAYGRERGVGIFVWKNCNDMAGLENERGALRSFLDAVRQAGAVGVKIDFFDSESKTRVDYQRAILRLAAERRLMVVFHGIQKPTGEARTFPNEISREGIRGVELNIMQEGPIPASHNAALPFTRYAVGHGDYTPLAYSKPGPTTWAHQLATVVQGTSPFLVIAENPDMLLRNPATQPALDVLKAIPSAWDETRVLAPSKIGELAVIARRKGDDWFLTALNGDRAVSIAPVELSFLEAGRTYTAVAITSPVKDQLERRESSGITAVSRVPVDLAPGDGAVWWFSPESGGSHLR